MSEKMSPREFVCHASSPGREYMYDLDEVLSPDIAETIILEFNSDNSQETIENENTDTCKEENVEIERHETEQNESNVLEDTDTQRSELFEYMIKGDGSVICKLCGEILQSRSHWYRHKYKHHVAHQPLYPSPLYQCEQCLVFFKTKKGYMGHIASRHNETLYDTHPPSKVVPVDMASNNTATGNTSITRRIQDKNEDLDESIPKNAVPNHNAKTEKKNSRCKVELELSNEELQERRSREERLVAEIIERVKKECDAQGASTRRGYTKRTTVMNIH